MTPCAPSSEMLHDSRSNSVRRLNPITRTARIPNRQLLLVWRVFWRVLERQDSQWRWKQRRPRLLVQLRSFQVLREGICSLRLPNCISFFKRWTCPRVAPRRALADLRQLRCKLLLFPAPPLLQADCLEKSHRSLNLPPTFAHSPSTIHLIPGSHTLQNNKRIYYLIHANNTEGL